MICVVSVFGEDDGVQYSEPDYEGGANIPSLRQVQKTMMYLRLVKKDVLSL